jgi:hypothetical protein
VTEEVTAVFAAYLSITIIMILASSFATVVDLAQARFVLANMDDVGAPRSWLRPLAALKAAAAAGLLLGLVDVWPLGLAAAIGLVLFFAGALTAHVRAGVFHNIAVPGAYFVLAVASAVLVVAAH